MAEMSSTRLRFSLALSVCKLNYSSKQHKGFDSVVPAVVRGGQAAAHGLVDGRTEMKTLKTLAWVTG